jgi:DnaJ-class molecular chaperone
MPPSTAPATREPDWCPRCNATGHIHVEWDWSSGYEEHITEKCENCNGRGFLEEDPDEEHDL